jgi:hypothetical protein
MDYGAEYRFRFIPLELRFREPIVKGIAKVLYFFKQKRRKIVFTNLSSLKPDLLCYSVEVQIEKGYLFIFELVLSYHPVFGGY